MKSRTQEGKSVPVVVLGSLLVTFRLCASASLCEEERWGEPHPTATTDANPHKPLADGLLLLLLLGRGGNGAFLILASLCVLCVSVVKSSSYFWV